MTVCIESFQLDDPLHTPTCENDKTLQTLDTVIRSHNTIVIVVNVVVVDSE